jgi:hypothetical protein
MLINVKTEVSTMKVIGKLENKFNLADITGPNTAQGFPDF